MLHVRNLRAIKAGQTVCRVPELDVQRGERVAVIGPNGSGKTTLMRVIGGLENDFTGHCRAKVPLHSRVYLHQSPYLFRGSVLFNTTYGLAARNTHRRDQISTVREWLNKLGVEHLMHRKCTNLSGGEQRRVALARVFATNADILLLDEPFADLDQDGIDVVCRAISTAPHSAIILSSPVPLPESLPFRSVCIEGERHRAK